MAKTYAGLYTCIAFLMAVVNFKVTLTSEGVNENIYAAGFLPDQSQTIYGCFVFRYCLRTLAVILALHLWLQYTQASMVRVPGLWSKGHWFKSLQEHWENFLLRGQLSVPTLILASAPPPCVTVVACKRSLSFCQKCRWQGAAKHTCLPVPLSGFAWSNMVHGCMVYTERAKMAAVSPWHSRSTV